MTIKVALLGVLRGVEVAGQSEWVRRRLGGTYSAHSGRRPSHVFTPSGFSSEQPFCPGIRTFVSIHKLRQVVEFRESLL